MPSLDKPIALGRTAEVYAWEDGKVLKLLHNWGHPGNADHELRLAPTAANRQPIQLIVMHTAGSEAEIGKIYLKAWFVQAPLVIAVCAISSQAWVRESDRFNARLIDAAIVADHLILEAANHGLGTCWIAAFNVEAARSVLQLTEEAEPVIFTPLGYPADQSGVKARKPWVNWYPTKTGYNERVNELRWFHILSGIWAEEQFVIGLRAV